MRVKFSKKYHDMGDKLEPYLDEHAQIKENAPSEMKKLYAEFIALGNEEYNAAAPWN